MKTWLIQLLCNHKWKEDSSIYYRANDSRGIVEITYFCPKCNKVKKEVKYIR